jgi:Cof subfamily protein (haloacid dehalogenase superfamily)
MTTRLVALDIDGTLLDPYGELHDPVVEAVGALQRAGLQVVLCTGRRFRTSLPVAQRLGLSGPIVCNNGVLVKDIESGKTLHHAFLPPELYGEVLALMREVAPPLVYVDAYHEGIDMLSERVEAAHPFQQEYLSDNTEWSRLVDDLAVARPNEVIMMSAMADGETLDALHERSRRTFGARVHNHRLMNKSYQGYILEFLSPESGKWNALAKLARGLGVAPDEIAAVGDDHNDADMLRNVGMGLAMGNAVEAAVEGADHVVRSNAEGGAIEAIERILSRR